MDLSGDVVLRLGPAVVFVGRDEELSDAQLGAIVGALRVVPG